MTRVICKPCLNGIIWVRVCSLMRMPVSGLQLTSWVLRVINSSRVNAVFCAIS